MTKSELTAVLDKIENGIQANLKKHPFLSMAFNQARAKILDPSIMEVEAHLLMLGILQPDPVTPPVATTTTVTPPATPAPTAAPAAPATPAPTATSAAQAAKA